MKKKTAKKKKIVTKTKKREDVKFVRGWGEVFAGKIIATRQKDGTEVKHDFNIKVTKDGTKMLINVAVAGRKKHDSFSTQMNCAGVLGSIVQGIKHDFYQDHPAAAIRDLLQQTGALETAIKNVPTQNAQAPTSVN